MHTRSWCFALAAAPLLAACGQAVTESSSTGDPGTTTTTTTQTAKVCPAEPLDVTFTGAPGSFLASALSVSVDSACNIVLAGRAWAPVDLGGGPIGWGNGMPPEMGGAAFAFVARLDPSGKHLWSRALPDGASLWGKHTLAVDSHGGIVLSGVALHEVDLGGGPLTGNFEGTSQIFLLWLDADGNHKKSLLLKGNVPADVGYDYGFDRSVESLALDAQDNVVIGGTMEGKIDFGGTTLETVPQTYPGGVDYKPDVYVARYTPAGDLVFASRFGGDDYDRRVGLDATPSGETWVAFNYWPGGQSGGEPGGVAIFKLSPTGVPVVESVRDGSLYLDGPSVVAGPDGGVLVGGGGYLDLGAAGMLDASFAARFDADGKPRFAEQITGADVALVTSIAQDAAGGIQAIGGFVDTLSIHGKAFATSVGGLDSFTSHIELEFDNLAGASLGDPGHDIAVVLAPTPDGDMVLASLHDVTADDPTAWFQLYRGGRLTLRRGP